MKKEDILQKLKDLKLINKTHTMESRILVSDAVNIVDYFLSKNPSLLEEKKIIPPPPAPGDSLKKNQLPVTLQSFRNLKYVSVDPLNVSVFVQNKNIYNCDAKNAMNGTFFWDGNPNGILIQDGKVLCSGASHAWRGFPQAVIYCDIEGKVGMSVIKSAIEFPHVNRVKWAIGGFTLTGINSTPSKEGFNAQYADVLRNTFKTSVGYNNATNKIILGVHVVSTSYETQINDMKSLGCKYAIGLDGGGSSTIKIDGSVKLHTMRTLNNFITWK